MVWTSKQPWLYSWLSEVVLIVNQGYTKNFLGGFEFVFFHMLMVVNIIVVNTWVRPSNPLITEQYVSLSSRVLSLWCNINTTSVTRSIENYS